MLWYLSNDSLLFQCFPLSTQMINSPPILESALVRIRISDLVHVLTQITVAASPILETAPATEFESCRFGDKPPTALGISCRLKTNSSGESFNTFCKKTPLKQKLSHHTGLSQSTSAVAIKFSWMPVTHFTAESLSTFQCSGSIWITFNIQKCDNEDDHQDRESWHWLVAGGGESSRELSPEITFPIQVKGRTILQDHAVCKMSSANVMYQSTICDVECNELNVCKFWDCLLESYLIAAGVFNIEKKW